MICAHVLFWGVIAARLVQRNTATELQSVVATNSVPSRWNFAALILVGITMGSFYPLLLVLVVEPRFVGPRLLPDLFVLRMAGLITVLVGIALIAWSYSVLKSFNLRPGIDRGHQLCMSGPYARIRHPVYLGIDFFFLGCFLLLPFPGFLLQTAVNFIAYDFRARVEEEVMKQAFGEVYLEYRQRTFRLIPLIY